MLKKTNRMWMTCLPLTYLVMAVMILLSTTSLPGYCDDQQNKIILEVSTNKDNVPIRESAEDDGKIINILKKGVILRVASTRKVSWWEVLGDMHGYINLDDVKIEPVITKKLPAPQNNVTHKFMNTFENKEDQCNSYNSSFDINISSVKFACKEGFSGNGYESCYVTGRVSIESNCKKNFSADISCKADYNYETKDSFLSEQGSESQSLYFYLSYGYGYDLFDINFKPGRFSFYPIVRVKITEIKCEKNVIYDN